MSELVALQSPNRGWTPRHRTNAQSIGASTIAVESLARVSTQSVVSKISPSSLSCAKHGAGSRIEIYAPETPTSCWSGCSSDIAPSLA